MLVFPLHVIDVPGHSLHGVYGFLHNLKGLRVLLHMVGYLLHTHTHTQHCSLAPTHVHNYVTCS